MAVQRSSFPYDAAIFLVGLAAIPFSAPNLPGTHVGARPTNVGESFESGWLLLL